VDANFKESQLGKIRPGHRARMTTDLYGGGVVFEGEVEGLSAGTGSVFSLLPPENATGNWIKIIQRVPVRVRLSGPALAENPLLLGLSVKVKVRIAEDPGPRPAAEGGGWSGYSAVSEDLDLDGFERAVEGLLAEGAPEAAPVGQSSGDPSPGPAAPGGLPGE
jgi:membrane fusion protein (multidrug efflux system)